jgi:outer membrane protein OmpA-like peptidoglycan-associated protein
MTPVEPDMTPVEPDMTPVEPDMTPVEPDMTPVEPDMGPTEPDMGPTEPDMGPSPRPDMEVIEVDGGGCPACPDSSTEEPEDDLELVGGGGCSTGGGAGTAGGAGLVIGFILLVVGILKRSKLWLIIAVLLLAGSALGSVAHAAPPVNNFKTAPSVNDYYTTMNPRTLGHLDFNGQIMLNYSHKPLRIIRKSTGETVDTVLRFRMNLDIALALGLYDVFELGFVVPTSAGQGAGNLAPLGTKLNNHDFQLADFKDLRIIPKFNLGSVNLSESTFLRFGLAFPITAPTGDRERLLGENGPTVAPTLLAGLDHKYFSLGLNVGVLARHNQDHSFRNQTINSSDEFLYGVGLNVPLVEDFGWLHKLDLIGDIWGSVQFAQQDKEEVSLEAMGGLRAHLKHGIVANVAAGGGLTKGYGVPEYRVMWGVGWEFDWQKSKPCPTCDKPKPCPPSKTVVKPVPVPVIVEKTLVIPPVYFDTDKHNLRPDALKTLKQTVKLLKENMWVKRVRLEGHCDHRMPHKYNDKLALRRVNTVKKYLVDNGISVKRLEARGYGERQRVDTTQKEPGMQKNRRVEFHILEVE